MDQRNSEQDQTNWDIICTSGGATSNTVKKYSMPEKAGALAGTISKMHTWVCESGGTISSCIANEKNMVSFPATAAKKDSLASRVATRIVSRVERRPSGDEFISWTLNEPMNMVVHNIMQIKGVQAQLLRLPYFKGKDNLVGACVFALNPYTAYESAMSFQHNLPSTTQEPTARPNLNAFTRPQQRHRHNDDEFDEDVSLTSGSGEDISITTPTVDKNSPAFKGCHSQYFSHSSESKSAETPANMLKELNMKKSEDIFDESEATALVSLAETRPADAYKTLKAYFETDFTLTEELMDSESYKKVVEALGFIGRKVEYFEFSTDILWCLSDKEGQLDYFGNAVNKLKELFTNFSFPRKITLEKKMQCLSKILVPKNDNRTNILDALVEILAVAASVDHSKTRNPDLLFEEYINFCVNALVKLSEQLEEAQKKLYKLAGREIITEDFILYRGAKNSDKIAKIDVDFDNRTNLNLHERQSLAERLSFINATNIHGIKPRNQYKKPETYVHETYVIANFGMVITDRPHKKKGDHKRKFKTIPIQFEDLAITGKDKKAGDTGHSEEALYAFLLEESRVMILLAAFKQRYGISAFDHKIYAIVLDLHGTYDMCLSCSKKGLYFQNAFRELLLACFEKHHLKALTSYPKLLPIVVRYSSDIGYDYSDATVDKCKGLLTRHKGKKFSDSPNGYDESRNIQYRDPNLLLHGTTSWHALWDTKRKQHTNKDLPLESWTAFVTSNTHSRLTTSKQHFNYTRLGLVETFDPTVQTVQEGVGNLTIKKRD